MCGIDFVAPFQGLNGLGNCPQGVALGCHVERFQRDDLRPNALEQGKKERRCRKFVGKLCQALRVRKDLLRAIDDSEVTGPVALLIIHRSTFAKC
jgi:hypothetical protein